MLTISDYQVLADGGFTLFGGDSPSQIRDFTVRLPENFVFGTNRAKPILSFVVNPLQVIPDAFDGSLFLRAEVGRLPSLRLAGSFLFPQDNDGTFSPRGERLVWTSIDGDDFAVGENIIRLHIQNPAQSSVRISDVVLWYQLRLDE